MEIIRSALFLLTLTTLLVCTSCSNDDLKHGGLKNINVISDILKGHKIKEYLDAFSKTKNVPESEIKSDKGANEDGNKIDFGMENFLKAVDEILIRVDSNLKRILDLEDHPRVTNYKEVAFEALLNAKVKLSEWKAAVGPKGVKMLNELEALREMEIFKGGNEDDWRNRSNELIEALMGILNVGVKVIKFGLNDMEETLNFIQNRRDDL